MTDPIHDMIQKTKARNLVSSQTIERIGGDMVAELRKTSEGRKRLSEIVAERFGTEDDANEFLRRRAIEKYRNEGPKNRIFGTSKIDA